MAAAGAGYVTDIPYTRGFFYELAPAWLDFTATIAGIAPPARPTGFTWCELGCGQGVTTALLAATHPHGRFVGIDLIPEHVDHARCLATAAKIGNAEFHTADFADHSLCLPPADYIVAHGVYAWVDAAAQAGLRRFIDRHLKPGGLVYLSYNAMPGWSADLPFQRLLLALASGLPGDGGARFAAAAERMRPLISAGAPSLSASTIAGDLDKLRATLPAAYLAHEYMGAHWQPLFAHEVRRPLTEIGLVPAGSATCAENFDAFVLRRAEREALDGFDDPELRELVRDFLRHVRFRRDVFSRGGKILSERTRRKRLMTTRFALARPAELVALTAEMPGAGTLSFDNPTARGIVAALAAGPRRLTDIDLPDIDVPFAPRDLIANIMALCSAGSVRAVEARDVPVAEVNRVLQARLGGAEAIEALALRCGTAVRLDTAVLRSLYEGDPEQAAWRRYAALHCGADCVANR